MKIYFFQSNVQTKIRIVCIGRYTAIPTIMLKKIVKRLATLARHTIIIPILDLPTCKSCKKESCLFFTNFKLFSKF